MAPFQDAFFLPDSLRREILKTLPHLSNFVNHVHMVSAKLKSYRVRHLQLWQ